MRIVRQLLIGLVSVVFLLGGVTMVTPLGSEAQAAPPVGPLADQNAEMTEQHEEIKTEIGAQHTTTKGAIGTAQTAIQGTVQTESADVQTAVGAVESELTTQHGIISDTFSNNLRFRALLHNCR